MMKLVWNDEIAATAQRWADQCKWGSGHDKVNGKCDGTAVGQNIFESNGFYTEDQVMASLPYAVKGWYNEVVQPGGDEIIPFPSSNIQPFK